MEGFGALLRRLRGRTPLRELAARAGLSYSHLANLEAGRKTARDALALRLLTRGLGLEEREARGLVLDLRLVEWGLRDRELRGLVRDVVLGKVPAVVRGELRRLYGSYTRADGF
jgi:transcriptional regulator with XRE-family HTH domain